MSGDTGPGRKPRVTDEELLEMFRDTDDPVLSTDEVAARLPIKRRATYERLSSLREDGRLNGKQIAGKATVYWLPETDELA